MKMVWIVLIIVHALLCLGAAYCFSKTKHIKGSGLKGSRVWGYYVFPFIGPLLLAVFSVLLYVVNSENIEVSGKKENNSKETV